MTSGSSRGPAGRVRWWDWASGRAVFRYLGRAFASLQGAVRQIPGYDRFERWADRIVGWLFERIRLPVGVEARLDPLLDIERGRRMDRPLVLVLFGAMVWLGLYASPLGHLDTTPYVFTVLPIVSGLSPYLGLVSGLLFSVADWVAKWLPFESVYGANWSNGIQNYFGARIGYVFAYSTVFVAGVLPGVMARIFRRLFARLGPIVLARPAVARAGLLMLAGTGVAVFAEGGGPAVAVVGGLGLVAMASVPDPDASDRIDPDSAARLAGAVGGVLGGVLGGVGTMEFAKAVGNDFAFEHFRADPDVSCKALSRGNWVNRTPHTAGGGGAGGWIPPADADEADDRRPDPRRRDYGDRDNPWDPSDDEQRRMWDEKGLVWDPDTLSWRDPKPDEIPRPDDYPEEPTPFEKDLDRNDVPSKCVGLYDQYVTAQAGVLDLMAGMQAAEQRYFASHQHWLKQMMKLNLNLAWEAGSAAGGLTDAVVGAGSGLRRGLREVTETGVEVGMEEAGGISQAFARARARISSLAAQVGRLSDTIRTATRKATDASRTAQGLRRMVAEARKQADELRRVVSGAARVAEALPGARQAVAAAEESVAFVQRQVDGIRNATPVWNRFSAAEEALDAAKRRLDEATSRAAADMEAYRQALSQRLRAADDALDRVERQLVEVREDLGDARAGRNMTGAEQTRAIQQLEGREAELVSQVRQLDAVQHQLANHNRDLQGALGADLGGGYPTDLFMNVVGESGTTFEGMPESAAAVRAARAGLSAAEAEFGAANKAFQRVGHLDPSHLPQRLSELDAAKGRLEDARTALSELAESQLDPGELAEKQHRLGALENNIERGQERLSEALDAAATAQEELDAARLRMKDVKQALHEAQNDLDALGPGPGEPGGPRQRDIITPGATEGVKQGASEATDDSLFGEQTGQEMGRILQQVRARVEQDLLAFQAAQADYEAGMTRLRTIRPQLDRCIELNAPFDED